MTNEDIDKKIAKLQKEIELLEYERSTNVTGIRPSETENLIKKWYGHCFSFEGIEYGSLDIILKSIKIDRKEKSVRLDGNMVMYPEPDTIFLPTIKHRNINVSPYGGTFLCQGEIDITSLPYISELDWNNSIAREIDIILTNHQMDKDKFHNSIIDYDGYGDFDYLKPLDEIIKEYETDGWDYDYKEIFNKL